MWNAEKLIIFALYFGEILDRKKRVDYDTDKKKNIGKAGGKMLYEFKEHGVSRGSELFLSTQSRLAEELLFYLHRCGRFVCTREYRIVRSNFNSYLLFYVEKGSMRIENEGKKYLVQAGDGGIINCHFPHAYIAAEDDTVFIWAHFDGSNTQQFYEEIAQRGRAVFHLPEKNILKDNLEAILDLHRQSHSFQGVMLEPEISMKLNGILCGLLFMSEEDGTVGEVRNQTISKAIQYIRKHYKECIGVKDVAEEVGLSLYHFSRLFKKETGCAPHDFIVIMRMNAAKKLLKTTELSIEEIALKIGYEYSASFVNAFTRRVGVTPKKFRDMPV